MIELKNLTISNSAALLVEQNLTLPSNTLTALIGRNGSGKSTLLRVISGEQSPMSGEVIIGGTNPAKATAAELAKIVSVVTTESVRVRNLTCRQLIALGRSPYTGLFGKLTADDEQKVDDALNAVGMGEFANRQITQISDGEMRRIMIARALAQDTPVMLLDEPTSFLDVPGRYEICRLLAELAHRHGKTILYSTHELEQALQYSDWILLLAKHSLQMHRPSALQQSPPFQSIFAI